MANCVQCTTPYFAGCTKTADTYYKDAFSSKIKLCIA
jgi:hypothetical protein